MKMNTTLFILSIILTTTNSMAQNNNEETAIKETIIRFAKAADERDTAALEIILDHHFSLGLNQLFGNTELATIDKSTYLNKIKAKEFGGDKREVKMEHLVVVKNNAQLQVTFKGSKMTIVTLIQLIKNKNGEWKILNDIPSIL